MCSAPVTSLGYWAMFMAVFAGSDFASVNARATTAAGKTS